MSAAPRPTLVDSRRQFWWGEHELIDYGIPARIGTSAWTIYTCLLRHINSQSITFPSVQLLMAESGLSNRVIAKSIAILKEVHLIEVDRTSHQWNEYRVLDALQAVRRNGWQPIKEARDEKSPAAKTAKKQVMKSHVPRDEKSPEQVTKSHTKKNQLKITSEKGGVYDLEGDARATHLQSTPVGGHSSAPISTSSAAREIAGRQTSSVVGMAVLPPDGGAAHAAKSGIQTPSQVQIQPPAGRVDQATSTEQVPGAAGGPRGDQDSVVVPSVDALLPVFTSELSMRPPAHPGSEVYKTLQSLLGKNLGGYLQEYTRTGSIPRTRWLHLTLVELELVRDTAQAEAWATQGNMLTLAIRGLDRLIGAVSASRAPGSGSQPALPTVTPNGSSLSPAVPLEQVADIASTDRYAPGARWQAVEGGLVVTIDRTTNTPSKSNPITLYHMSDGCVLKSLELMQRYRHVG